MRVRATRLLAILLLLTVAGVALAGRGAHASSDYHIDAIFDTAKGIIPGNALKIAGARVGTVQDVVLTPDFKARIEMTAQGRFAPFHADAHCDLQQEALIGERFVQCDPGRPSSPPLVGRGGHAPTVPVQNTFVPVSFTDIFNIFHMPVRDRVGVLVATLGLGIAGRGDDFNQILRRANPTLLLIRRALRILNSQRTQLQSIIAFSDRIGAQLAPRSARVRAFIASTSRFWHQTAGHHTALSDAVARLPGMLDAARPTLHRLNAFARTGGPLLAGLRVSAPQLQRLVRSLPPFAHVGIPAVRDLGTALDRARPLVRHVTPQFRQLGTFARDALPAGRLLAQMFTNVRDRGGVESLLALAYSLAAGGARYDATAHLLPLNVILNNCIFYSEAPVPGCDAHWGPVTVAAPARRERHHAERSPARAPQSPAPAQGPVLRLPSLPSIQLPHLPRLPGGPRAPSSEDGSIKHLLDYLLR
jgi:ABC-type transporter Mla subunit MlaD